MINTSTNSWQEEKRDLLKEENENGCKKKDSGDLRDLPG